MGPELRDQTLKYWRNSRASTPGARGAIGILTPSANIVVEYTTIRLLRAFSGIGAHFSRIPVKGPVDPTEAGYDVHTMLSAAALLADAKPGALLWAGSKGVQFGIDKERRLCEHIQSETGVAATTPTLALEKLIRERGIAEIGLISPYSSAYQTQVVEGFERMGIACVAEAHAGVADNLAYASVTDATIKDMARRVAAARPDAIVAWCTNFAAGPLAGAIEREVGVPFYDATTLGLSQALTILGVDLARAPALWGAVFRDHSLANSN